MRRGHGCMGAPTVASFYKGSILRGIRFPLTAYFLETRPRPVVRYPLQGHRNPRRARGTTPDAVARCDAASDSALLASSRCS